MILASSQSHRPHSGKHNKPLGPKSNPSMLQVLLYINVNMIDDNLPSDH